MTGAANPVDVIFAQLESAPGMQRLRELTGDAAEMDGDLVKAILAEALKFSTDVLMPFDTVADRQGCRLENGRVMLAPGHKKTWDEFREAQWIGLDIPAQFGGQGLSAVVATAVQECFDQGCVSFGMVPGSARSAARLLRIHAGPDIVAEWLPKLAAGEWSTTICISESDAGSDVGRIRTSATRTDDGTWRIRGEKMWISFGDHDLVKKIGHIVLARPVGAAAGVRGLSLFLVPSVLTTGEATLVRNSVLVRRIEEKMGLHGSPTCALGFEDAHGVLIGAEGRGVAQLFSMIVSMRLQVGAQGLGLAQASYAAALAYAAERRQGGRPDAGPVLIATHADVQMALLGMASRIKTMRGLVYAAAIAGDLVEAEPEGDGRTAAASLQSWLLPIIKNSGAETGFDVSAEAILVFGGAGFTKEWPVERHLRDSRVLAIYEGTTGMQALDLVRRRWRIPDKGYEVFLAAVQADLATAAPSVAQPLSAALALLEEATSWLRDPARLDAEVDAAARAALRVATEVAHGWIGARLAALPGTSAEFVELAACGRFAVSVMAERVPAAWHALRAAPDRVRAFSALGG